MTVYRYDNGELVPIDANDVWDEMCDPTEGDGWSGHGNFSTYDGEVVEYGYQPTDIPMSRMFGQNVPCLNQVRPNLFIGDYDAAERLAMLQALGVTAVVNCTKDTNYPMIADGSFRYIELNLNDGVTIPVGTFDKFFRFMRSVMRNPKAKVFIHCHAGISRSATFVIAWLMYKEKMTFEQARKDLKEIRPITYPHHLLQLSLGEYFGDMEAVEDARRRFRYEESAWKVWAQRLTEEGGDAQVIVDRIRETFASQGEDVLEAAVESAETEDSQIYEVS